MMPAMESCEMIFARKLGGIFCDLAMRAVEAFLSGSIFER
jgi:hypothetical protein